MRDNPVRRALKAGRTVVGTMIQEVRSPGIALLLADVGFDFFFIDMEHGAYDLETVADIIKVARLAGIVPLVRVPDNEYHLIARALDAGAMGVMVPRVETVNDVARAVAAMRYPPVGRRGYSAGKGNSDYRRVEMRAYTHHANENVLVIVQIERKAAVEHIDDLLSVPGVDVALIGPADLTLSLGAESPHAPEVTEAIEHVFNAARRHRVAAGIHLRQVEGLLSWQAKGMTMLTYSTDLDLLREAATAALKTLRGT